MYPSAAAVSAAAGSRETSLCFFGRRVAAWPVGSIFGHPTTQILRSRRRDSENEHKLLEPALTRRKIGQPIDAIADAPGFGMNRKARH
jgi:hypothetical protein